MTPSDERCDHYDRSSYSALQVGRYLLQVSFLRNILIVCLALACLLPIYKWLYLTPAYRQLMHQFNKDEAGRIARHLIRSLKIETIPLGEVAVQAQLHTLAEELKTDFQLENLKLINAQGQTLFSSDPSEVGSINTHAQFLQMVAKGKIFAKTVTKGERTLENRATTRDVVEIYIPIMQKEKFIGAFEIYYDITAANSHLASLSRRSNIIGLLISVGMMLVVIIVLFKAGQAMLTHGETDKALQRARIELENRVDERTNDLFQSNKALQLEITQRTQAEKKLLDTNKFMTALIDTIPNPIFYKDYNGVFLGCNTAYHETLGLDKPQIIGRTLLELEGITFKGLAETYHQQDLSLIQSPGIQFQEQQMIAAQGERRDYMLCKATFRDTDGCVAGLVGIMLDITGRKKMEKELKASKNLFDNFMHHLPGLAFMKDLQGRYIFVNRAFSKFSRTEAGDPIGLRDDQLWDAKIAQQIIENDQKVFQTQETTNFTETITSPNNRQRYLLITRFPIFQDEQLTALGGVAIDITEHTHAENQRQQLERQLLQAQKMEALGTLAGGVAHDFNNILTGIVGYTQIAVADLPPESPIKEYLARVLQAGEHAGDLVKQILTFSRKRDIEPTPIQMKPIVKEVLKLVRSTLPVTIQMTEQIKSETYVKADPVQIHQVMMNMCANAGYAMRLKGGNLTVTMEDVIVNENFSQQFTDLAPGPYLRLSVADTGTGIAPENLDRIFDPFFTTKPKGEGTGMGLSVVHGIINSLEGKITVQSTLDKGTRFDIYLPALKGQHKEVKTKEPLPRGNEQIFFLDDEVYHTDMVKHMLGLLGYKVHTSNSAPEAVAVFEKDPSAFDLMITDMVMPDMTGDLVAEKILQLRPDLPIIMCTGYSENISEERAKAIGIRALLLKPLSMEDLARIIREVLDKKE